MFAAVRLLEIKDNSCIRTRDVYIIDTSLATQIDVDCLEQGQIRDYLLKLNMLSIICRRKSTSGSVGSQAHTFELR